jgi:hypothetical protein
MSDSITNLSDAVAAMGALPMPVGTEPQADADSAKAPWGRDEDGPPLLGPGAHWTDVPELVDQELARIRGRVDQAQCGHWYVASDTETWRPPGTVRTNVDGYQRTVGRVTNMLPGDLELVLHAHDDLSWCLEMVAKLGTRVAELEAERHVTNEALSKAVERLADLEALKPAMVQTCRKCGAGYTYGEPCSNCLFRAQMAAESAKRADASADRLTRLLAPTQALREVPDGEHYTWVHHDHLKGHDLPETGGVS